MRGRAAAWVARGRRTWWLLGLLAALLATTPAWWPWTDPRLDLWEVDDAKNHMLRLYHFGWLLEHGVWYPRWVPEMFLGYGYPLFNYYAPGFYYLALLLRALLRLDIWDGYRAAGVVAALLGAAGAYVLATALWRRASLGVLAALALLYGPYVYQINLFKRGDLPEALGLALIPWLLLAIWHLWLAASPGRTLAWLAGAAAAGSAVILVHNLTALIAAAVAAVWVAYLFVARPSLRRLLRVVLAGALAAGLTAFFWLPAIGEGRLVHLEELRGIGGLDYRGWLIEPSGNTPRQQAPDSRQTRTGLIDLNLHYPHELIAPPKLSLAQAALGVLATLSLAAGAARPGWHVLSRRRAHRQRATAGGHLNVLPVTVPPAQGNGMFGLGRANGAPNAAGQAPRHGRAGGDLNLAPPFGAGLPLLLVAGGCWFLTFAASAPVWSRVPVLPLLQFPWRLMGPVGLCLAVAGAGALARPLALLEDRWGGRGRAAGWGVVALVAGAVLVNSLGDRHLLFREGVQREIDGRAVVADEIDDAIGAGTTSAREFLPREVQIATYTAGQRRGRAVFERLYPEADWLGGRLQPLAGDLRLLGWRAGPLRLSVRLANDAPAAGQLGVRQLRFPGWRAWLDGRPAPVGAAPYVPEQQAAPGFVVLAVPPGEHDLGLAFGPTPARLAGLGLTLLAAWAAAGALAGWLRRRRWAGWLLPLLLAGACAYPAWRGVRPLVPGLAAPPAAPAQAAAGVWRAPDLGRGGAGLLVNLAEAVRAGPAGIASPAGAAVGADAFVDVRQLSVADQDLERGAAGTSRRQWLYLHPPAAVSVDVALPPGRQVWLQAALALDPAAWAAPVGDGVRFRAEVARLDAAGGAGAPAAVLDRPLNPRARTEHRRWVPVEADLSPWAGATVRLTLRTEPGEDPSYDWGGWGNPVVVVRESARTRPPATSEE